MPENKPAFFVAPLYLFDVDDDSFGDFKCAPSIASHLPALAPSTPDANGGCEGNEDEWGEFVAISAPPPPSFKLPVISGSVVKPWEKPGGALPLSIFGEEDAEVEEEEGGKELQSVGSQSVFHKTDSLSNEVGGGSGGGGLVDLIADLYRKAGVVSGPVDLAEDDSWEFKSASSAEVGFYGDKSVIGINGGLDGTGIQEATDLTSANQKVECGTAQPLSSCSSLPNLLIGYSRVKELSLLLVVQHIHDLQREDGLSSLDGKLAKKVELNKEIQAAYGQETSDISSNYLRTYSSRDLLVCQLLELIKEPQFEYFELEYFLSKTISSAKEDLGMAVSLFEHAVLVVGILRLASLEEQKAYINTWSEVAKACAKELTHGAKIWEESCHSNISEQILSKGTCYFVALGEIYHVIKILHASLKLYMPWILASKFYSNELLVWMDKCTKAWITHGLEETLHRIAATSEVEFSSRAKILLEAIASIQCLNDHILFEHISGKKRFCRLSLLPLIALQDTVTVAWEGEHYFVKLANLWVNLVSRDLPQLPRIHVG